jgi:hypothetical protein
VDFDSWCDDVRDEPNDKVVGFKCKHCSKWADDSGFFTGSCSKDKSHEGVEKTRWYASFERLVAKATSVTYRVVRSIVRVVGLGASFVYEAVSGLFAGIRDAYRRVFTSDSDDKTESETAPAAV